MSYALGIMGKQQNLVDLCQEGKNLDERSLFSSHVASHALEIELRQM